MCVSDVCVSVCDLGVLILSVCLCACFLSVRAWLHSLVFSTRYDLMSVCVSVCVCVSSIVVSVL